MLTPTTTTTTRDHGLDTLRALAIVRVFLWHATGWAVLTWIGALPVMFFVTGALFARSATRNGTARTLLDRARRLLLPYWFFGLVMLAVMYALTEDGTFPSTGELLGWLLPVIDPVGAPWQQGWITEPLWYLRTYTWLLLAAPVAIAILRRGHVVTLLALLGCTSLAGQLALGVRFWALQDLVTYGFFFVAGAASALGLLALTSRQLRHVAGVALAAVLVAARLDPPADGVVNNAHFLHLLVGVLWLSVAHLALDALRSAADKTWVRRGVAFVTSRSLSIYLWHAPIVGATYVLAGRLGLTTGMPQTLLVTTIAAALTVLGVRVVGVVEDLAGAPGRRMLRLPRARHLVGVSGCVLAAVTVLAQTAPVLLALPPTPSQAPEEASFVTDDASSFLLAPSPGLTQSAYADEINPPSRPALAQIVAAPRRDRPQADRRRADTPVPTPTTGATTPVTTTPRRAPSDPWSIPAIGAWGELAPVADDALVAEVQRLVGAWVLAEKNAGVEIAILQPGRQRLATAVDRNGEVVAPADMIPLASITKSFTAALLLRAVEEGRIELNQPIGRLAVAPWFDVADNVTFAQLMSHRSGIANYASTAAWQRDWASINGWEPALRAAQENGLVFPPGSKVEYSSTNFIVAGLLAAQIYGQPIEKLITDQLLRPLGLNRTTVGNPIPGGPGTGTGNMHAHVTDVARWGMAMWRDHIVMGPYANQLAAYTDPRALLGYGSFAWCPCRSAGGTTVPAAMGANGAEATLRYYAATDTIIAMRISGGVPASVEGLINDLLTLTR